MEVRRIADHLGLTFEGDGEREIEAVGELATAGVGNLSFVGNRKAAEAAPDSSAGCLLVPIAYPNNERRTVIRSQEPRADFARAVRLFHPLPVRMAGIHPAAKVSYDASIASSASVSADVVIGSGSSVGEGAYIAPGVVIGDFVRIGKHCTIHPRVTIYDEVEVGDHVVLHAGCVLGADGFGFVMNEGRYQQFPQVGRVVIESYVELGANTCVDRAALGVTLIGEGTKIDNMVHIGHNCRIGKHVVIAAQTGLSGGVVVEDYAVIGGQVGIGDKARVETRATLGSGCGILTSKIVRSGEVVWGTPARPLKDYLVQLANLAKIGKIREQIATLRDKVEKLETRLGDPPS
ncbi:MAG: UDP-3-O-(3-hydroxymyristoyl)glucosamine N-acyltransferase [Bryobacterales bacterium]|nr:UDP-3-O-(3-hydroxymyristoyl)glucosamine N-acyltransferase [Bryobacterales bacterium]